MTQGASGFWSYVHRDNEQTGGKMNRLAAGIAAEFSLLTGHDLQLFLDRDSIEWGDIWRERIESALQETTFFIPVITPRYFTSAECRRELMKFAAHARSIGATELLLPILYVDVADLTEGSPDEAKALIAGTQYVDWRDLRLADEDSEPYSRAVNALAVRLADIASAYEAQPSTMPSSGGVESADGDGEPGLIDLIADLEPRLPIWSETIDGFAPLIEAVGEVAERHSARFGSEGQDSFARRILIAREFAAELMGPAEAILSQGERYAGELLDIDPGVRAMIALAGEQEDAEDRAAAIEMCESIRTMVNAGQEGVAALTELIDSMRAPARLLKDIRPPLNKIESGLRNVIDGQTVLDEWARLIDELPDWDT